ncbi:MAG: PTS lactose transporter subunit IIB [Actinomycetota bacterium]
MTDRVTKQAGDVKLIVFACEAGMGSSLMGANQLKKMVKKAKLDITVIHCPVGQLTDEADVIVVHKGLAGQAKQRVPEAAIVPFTLFMNDPAVKALVSDLQSGEAIVSVL